LYVTRLNGNRPRVCIPGSTRSAPFHSVLCSRECVHTQEKRDKRELWGMDVVKCSALTMQVDGRIQGGAEE